MESKTSERYIESIGRRKTSVARVRITPATKQSYVINDKTLDEYFKSEALMKLIENVFETEEINSKFKVSIKVSGGGLNSQAGSIRLGIARSLVKFRQEARKELKKKGFLKRDPRVKERKKPGLKKARKSPQWSKR